MGINYDPPDMEDMEFLMKADKIIEMMMFGRMLAVDRIIEENPDTTGRRIMIARIIRGWTRDELAYYTNLSVKAQRMLDFLDRDALEADLHFTEEDITDFEYGDELMTALQLEQILKTLEITKSDILQGKEIDRRFY
tara:strand:- start:92 stop:502 length:411 start_codon:yes stop_codon:yes gene_type:complete